MSIDIIKESIISVNIAVDRVAKLYNLPGGNDTLLNIGNNKLCRDQMSVGEINIKCKLLCHHKLAVSQRVETKCINGP